MIVIGPSNENEVILAFLRAEINSPRFSDRISSALATSNLKREAIIDNADLTNQSDNKIRSELLDFRGYTNRTSLFQGFPRDVVWQHVELEPGEFNQLKYLKYDKFLKISKNTRLIVDGAENLDLIEVNEGSDNFNGHIRDIINELKQGIRYPELVGIKSDDGYIIIAEGNTRATAHVASSISENMKIILGTSPSVAQWCFY